MTNGRKYRVEISETSIETGAKNMSQIVMISYEVQLSRGLFLALVPREDKLCADGPRFVRFSFDSQSNRIGFNGSSSIEEVCQALATNGERLQEHVERMANSARGKRETGTRAPRRRRGLPAADRRRRQEPQDT